MKHENALSYLADIPVSRLMNTVGFRNWSEVASLVPRYDYDRLGLDRLLTIIQDMETVFGQRFGLRILDVGCNNGLFSIGLAALGHQVTGIDSLIINEQGRYAKLTIEGKMQTTTIMAPNGGRADLLARDVSDYLKETVGPWDVVLLLSVTHQWEYGYAYDKSTAMNQELISRNMESIMRKTVGVVYYECPVDEPGFSPGYGLDFLHRFVKQTIEITPVATTVGSSGYMRELYRICPAR